MAEVLGNRRVNDHAVEVIPPEGYRSPAWYEARRGCVSASEIAVLLGISPYQSAFDLWWSKRVADSKADNKAMSRGRRVEPLVLEDFEIEHPELRLGTVGLIRNVERPYQVATPDALAYDTERRVFWDDLFPRSPVTRLVESAEPVAVIEAKTAGGSEGWGERGTDEVPVHYRAQVIWQMDTLGLTEAFIPVWIGFDFRCYRVEYDADDAAYMREQAQAFLASLEHDVVPDIDDHTATTDRLKRLHPTVVDGDAVVDEAVVRQYLAAKRLRDAAIARMRLAENRLRNAIGDNKRGVLADGRKVASRSVYDVAERTQVVGAHTVSKLTVTEPKSPTTTRSRKKGS